MYQTIARTCPTCGATFDARTNGRARTYCTTSCKRRRNYAGNTTKVCTLEGCEKPRYQGNSLCVTHNGRRFKYGDTSVTKSRIGTEWEQSHGYKLRGASAHPLADKRGAAYTHRLVLFEKVGDGTHPCHWCNTSLTWGINLTTDHLNDDRADNRPANLVPCCQSCNARRALAKRWGNPWPDEGTR